MVDLNDSELGPISKFDCKLACLRLCAYFLYIEYYYIGHRNELIQSQNICHRAFSVFLFNSKGELLLQRRSAAKITFPGLYTNTCCSHPLYTEEERNSENFIGIAFLNSLSFTESAFRNQAGSAAPTSI